eukprot:1181875-Karenia_brevis.AAC.1
MCSICGTNRGIETANNTLKHIRDYHRPAERAVLLEMSACFDEDGNVPPDFSPHGRTLGDLPEKAGKGRT